MALQLKYRHKLLIPAASALAATLLATAVTQGLSGRAAVELDRVERRHVPALLLAQELEAELARLQRQLQDAAGAEETAALEQAGELHREMARRIAEAPPEVLSRLDQARLAAELEAYHRVARTATARLIRRDRGEELTGALRAMAAAYLVLREDLAASTRSGRQAMAEGFAAARSDQRRAVLVGSSIVILATLLAAALAWIVARGLSRPLEILSSAARRVSEGDLTAEIPPGAGDEVGALADGFRRMQERLREIVSTLRDSSGDLAGAAGSLSRLAAARRQALELQAGGVAETSSTTRELEQASSVASTRAAAVLEVAHKAAQMSDAGQSSATRSLEGIQRIQEAVQQVLAQSGRLFEQARQVGDIVETVKDLATRSHVLSLNASIEAARAGEAGRGFAVVAAEVRALAEQSGASATSIGKIVEDILGAVEATRDMTERSNKGMEGSMAAIRAAGESLRDIGGIVRETSDAALQIASAVQQQSTGIGQIAASMRDVDSGMQDTVARIQSLEEATDHLNATAGRISQIVSGFRI